MLGIDIGSSTVKLLELEALSDGSGYRIRRFAVVPIPAGAVDGKKIVDQDAVAEAVRQAIKQSGASTKRVASAVSGVTVITKLLQMPSGVSESEMESMVEYEADQQIPQNLDEIRYDFDIVGPSANDPNLVDVLLVASRGDVVDDLTATLELAGLKPAVIDVESYAVNHCYAISNSAEENAACVAVADIGAATTDFHVMKGDAVIYSREYNFGGRLLSRELQSRFGLTAEQAEYAKAHGEWPEGAEGSVVKEFIASMIQEVRGALQIYRASNSREEVTHLYLCGGSVRLPGLILAAEQVFDVPVSILEPFQHMQHDKHIHINRLNQIAPSMVVACGLATRRFD